MRDFSWKYFSLTGNVDAFLLYKEMHQISENNPAEDAAFLEMQEIEEEGTPAPG
ncbi:YqzL-like protein [Paenibacillus cellulosilyticus]|uniref:YqzL-like protein n=1 Tax=Paenibacillus cellulosilyticus TaxID=375489 RepID=A0A2V2YMJ7_9BACL|nr:YqzL family protein [Paenibacillus cellulosilyticus]PWV95417.1 YqzL-like protein [Paenibacillus cellulosilyticus]QKS43202.1 YqzL family protein [Paenibacillus cellulosilyticus]